MNDPIDACLSLQPIQLSIPLNTYLAYLPSVQPEHMDVSEPVLIAVTSLWSAFSAFQVAFSRDLYSVCKFHKALGLYVPNEAVFNSSIVRDKFSGALPTSHYPNADLLPAIGNHR